ncbi:MAG: branched-chain amino acid transporter permease [Eubacteriales bacterium]|jgi:branched-subunit amino acid transport protein AzlD
MRVGLWESLAIIGVMAAVTLLTRALPFFCFRQGEVPGWVQYLGRVLPPAVMAMLIVYSFRNVELFGGSHGLPELIAAVTVVGLHVWKRNNLLSILAGTAVYMVCVQVIFV